MNEFYITLHVVLKDKKTFQDLMLELKDLKLKTGIVRGTVASGLPQAPYEPLPRSKV